ncbi:hypothetical protein [Croceitalea sp. P059]|uniref:hypothetical protein n=1 Tax=Croceitalea sp. P059 TaxID=3075601 RepID=UPI002887ACA5|nr:hypothetical protein [Croceitalea sp. P059]MDT0538957.1 hypothetical protein [Croceitalea sp. P059]
MKSRKINSDRILGISAMAISVLTLAIFIYQTDIMRVQSKLSVKPRLDFTTNQGGNDSIIIFQQVIENKGLGPAIIDSIYFKYNDKIFSLDSEKLLSSQLPKLLDYGYLSQHATLGRGTTLTPEEERSIYTYNLPASKLDSVLSYLNIGPDDDGPFEIEVIYTSIYEDEMWKVTSTNSQPNKVK